MACFKFIILLAVCVALTATVSGQAATCTIAHQGQCPPYNDKLMCPIRKPTCSSDCDCPVTQKCCMINCVGQECYSPTASVRPGSCPVLTAKYPPCAYFPPSEQNLCSDDFQCAGEQKCCKTYCKGLQCTEPTAPGSG